MKRQLVVWEENEWVQFAGCAVVMSPELCTSMSVSDASYYP